MLVDAIRCLTVEELHLLVFGLWGNWKEQNAVVHGEGEKEASRIAASIISKYDHWKNENNARLSNNSNPQSQPIKWKPPPGLLVIHSDATVNGDQACIRSIIRENFGNMKVALGEKLADPHSPRAAELKAISMGLEWAADQKWRIDCAYSDCIQAVQLIHADGDCRAEEGATVDHIRELLCRLGGILVKYILRCLNRVSDRIAKANHSSYGLHI